MTAIHYEVYQLAADMGGSTYINTGEHDSDVMHNSCLINLNVLKTCSNKNVKKIFYSSSACVYPEYNQLDPNNPKCSEDTTYPAGYDGDKEIKNKSMTIKDALYMLFSHSTCFNLCSTPVFNFIRMHLKTHFPRIELENPIPEKFNINRICNGYKILTVKNGEVTESTNLDDATRIIEVFMPEVKGPGEGDPVVKLYVNDTYDIGI